MSQEELESYCLLIQNLPEGLSDQESLTLFLENATEENWIDEEDNEYIEFNNTKTEALVEFRHPNISYEEAIRCIESKPFSGTTLKAQLAPECNRLLVTDLKDDIDQLTLELHFENRKISGVETEVTVNFDSSKHVAIITFHDPSVIDTVLSYGEHDQRLGPRAALHHCRYFTTLNDLTQEDLTSGESTNDESANQIPESDLVAGEAAGADMNWRGSRNARRFGPRNRGRGNFRGPIGRYPVNTQSYGEGRQFMGDRGSRPPRRDRGGQRYRGQGQGRSEQHDNMGQEYAYGIPPLNTGTVDEGGQYNQQFMGDRGSRPHRFPRRDRGGQRYRGQGQGRNETTSSGEQHDNMGQEYAYGVCPLNTGTVHDGEQFSHQFMGDRGSRPFRYPRRDRGGQRYRGQGRGEAASFGEQNDNTGQAHGVREQPSRPPYGKMVGRSHLGGSVPNLLQGLEMSELNIDCDSAHNSKDDNGCIGLNRRGDGRGFRRPGGHVPYHRGNANRGACNLTRGLTEGSELPDETQTERKEHLEGQSMPRGRGPQNEAGRLQRRNERSSQSLIHSSMESLNDPSLGDSSKRPSKRISVMDEVGSEKCRLLIFHMDQLKQFGCRVFVNAKFHFVQVTGPTEEAVTQTEVLVYQTLCDMQSVQVPGLSSMLLSMLSCSKGIIWMREFFKQNKLFAVFYVHQDVGHVIASNGAAAKTAVAMLKLQIRSFDIPYAEPQVKFLKSPQWQAFTVSVEKSELVRIEVLPDPQLLIRVYGVSSELENTVEVIQSQLSENSVTVSKLTMNACELRYLKTYQKEFIKKPKVIMQFIKADNTLEISGQSGAVEEAKTLAENFRQTLISDELPVNTPGITAGMFTNQDGVPSMTIASLEKRHHCIIEVEQKSYPLPVKCQRSQSLNDTFDACSQLLVVEGDITRFDQADVLVNSLGTESNDFSKAGVVPKAFLKAGGRELQEEFNRAFDYGDDVIVTPATGSLRAEKVFHVFLEKYVSGQNCMKSLEQKIQDCLVRALSLSMKSIAFPTLGCGHLEYKAHKVANCLKKAVSSVRNLKVYVIVRDRNSFETFNGICGTSSTLPTGTSSTALKRFLPDEDRSMPRSRLSSSVAFRICGQSQDVINKVKAELSEKLNDFVHKTSMKITNDLTPSEEQQICQLSSPDVQISIDTTRKLIEFKGEKRAAEKKHCEVEKLLNEFASAANNLDHIRKSRGQKAFLQVFCSKPEVVAPNYWKHYNGNLTDVISPHGKLEEVDVVLRQAVESLVSKTWESSKVGYGHDASGLTHTNIVVKKVWQNENVSLYKSYITHMKELYKHNASSGVPRIKGLDGEEDVKTITHGNSTLNDLLIMPEMNECFLFHGTDKSRKDAIANQGIDYRLGNHTALFGQGCYFAESSTKADQYADSRSNRVGVNQQLFMFLFRVVLGQAYVCREPRTFKRPPCTDAVCCSDMCSAHSLHDSVIGTHNYTSPSGPTQLAQSQPRPTRRLWFREFIVYDHYKCYPEFLIEYERV